MLALEGKTSATRSKRARQRPSSHRQTLVLSSNLQDDEYDLIKTDYDGTVLLEDKGRFTRRSMIVAAHPGISPPVSMSERACSLRSLQKSITSRRNDRAELPAAVPFLFDKKISTKKQDELYAQHTSRDSERVTSLGERYSVLLSSSFFPRGTELPPCSIKFGRNTLIPPRGQIN